MDTTVLRVAAVDPGKVNPAVWIGTVDFSVNKIKTEWGGAGADIIETDATISENAVHMGQLIASRHDDDPIKAVAVETPSTFNGKGAFVNVSAAVGAGVTYGYLRGCGIPNVCMSNYRTKGRAIEHFAEVLDVTLKPHLPGSDKATRAKNRLINKHNAKGVIIELLKFSEDTVGSELLERHREKKDDIADAILLACGLALEQKKKKKKRAPSKKK
ncbi:MAG: hypothetical protein P4L69_05985 [Desulfosporosinus sp.]|nr:hypothetical protein [Desulfosporosinus sp.]